MDSSPPSTPQQQPHGRAAAASPLQIYSPGKVPRLQLPAHVYAHAAHDSSHDGSAAATMTMAAPTLVSPRVFGHGFRPTASSMIGRGGSGGNEAMSPRAKPATPFSWQSFENSCVSVLSEICLAIL